MAGALLVVLDGMEVDRRERIAQAPHMVPPIPDVALAKAGGQLGRQRRCAHASSLSSSSAISDDPLRRLAITSPRWRNSITVCACGRSASVYAIGSPLSRKRRATSRSAPGPLPLKAATFAAADETELRSASRARSKGSPTDGAGVVAPPFGPQPMKEERRNRSVTVPWVSSPLSFTTT